MQDFDASPRGVAKFVAKALVHAKAKEIAENAITDYTQFEEDDLVVRLSSNVIGGVVSTKLKPYTDKMVDKTADFINAKREQRKLKKQQKEASSEEK